MFDDDHDDYDDDHDMDWDKVLRDALTSVVEWRPQEEEDCFVQLVEVVINQAIHHHYQSGAGKKIKYEEIGGDGYNYKTKLMDPVNRAAQRPGEVSARRDQHAVHEPQHACVVPGRQPQDTVQAEHTAGCQAGV